MDGDAFDGMAKNLGGALNRRSALRRLLGVSLGGALGGVAARLGLDEGAAANAKRKDRKRGTETQRRDPLQAEGKRKKRRGKNRDKKPQCDELTVPLCGACGEPICVAGDWACKAIGDTDCGNGVCVWDGECCPDTYRCDDGTCVDPFEECCPDQQLCPGGNCVGADECCPGQKKCPGYTECFAEEDCCPDALPPLCEPCDKVVCENGSLVCRPRSITCQPNEVGVCCQAGPVCRYSFDEPNCAGLEWLTYNPAICRCECPPGTHQTGGYCCPAEYPWFDGYGYCCRPGTCNDAVCAIGFSREGNGPCRRTT